MSREYVLLAWLAPILKPLQKHSKHSSLLCFMSSCMFHFPKGPIGSFKKLLDHHSSMEVFPPNSSIFRRSLTSSTQVCLAPCAAPRLWGPIWLKLRWQPSDTCFGKYFDKKRVVQEKQHIWGKENPMNVKMPI